MKDATILMPAFALAAWTGAILVWVAVSRIISRLPTSDFQLGESGRTPQRAVLANRNYMNLLELPVLFYVVSLMFFAAGNWPALALTLAWAYVGLRIVHSLIHLSFNHVMTRFTAFGLSNFALIGMWVLAWKHFVA